MVLGKHCAVDFREARPPNFWKRQNFLFSCLATKLLYSETLILLGNTLEMTLSYCSTILGRGSCAFFVLQRLHTHSDCHHRSRPCASCPNVLSRQVRSDMLTTCAPKTLQHWRQSCFHLLVLLGCSTISMYVTSCLGECSGVGTDFLM